MAGRPTTHDGTKRCGQCGFFKLFSKFWEVKGRPAGQVSGYRSRCKRCMNGQSPDPETDSSLPLAKGPNLAAFDAEPVDHVAPVAPTAIPERLTQVEEHRLKTRVRDLESELRKLVAELSDAQEVGDVVRAAQNQPVDPITPREHLMSAREGTALIMASDWHVEEEVRPEQVAGRNRYNLEISEHRMTRFFEAARWAINFSRTAFTIRDALLWLGGDFITNFLHPDNVETNLLSPPQALAYVMSGLVAGIRYLLEDPLLERLVIPCNDGNHGRMTDKMRSASRTAMSLEIMLYGMLAQEFADEPRVEFIIAGGEHLYYEVYGRTIRFAHGDSVRYGGGIGGITIPLFKAIDRWNTVKAADLSVVGHFHQRIALPNLLVNGSLIGYSPYSMTIGARHEAPSQNFAILDRARFHTMDLPLWVAEREDDQESA